MPLVILFLFDESQSEIVSVTTQRTKLYNELSASACKLVGYLTFVMLTLGGGCGLVVLVLVPETGTI